jgi:hypothetical protein
VPGLVVRTFERRAASADVHAARTKAIRELTLDDIDPPNRRITITSHRQPLGEFTHHAW